MDIQKISKFLNDLEGQGIKTSGQNVMIVNDDSEITTSKANLKNK